MKGQKIRQHVVKSNHNKKQSKSELIRNKANGVMGFTIKTDHMTEATKMCYAIAQSQLIQYCKAHVQILISVSRACEIGQLHFFSQLF